VLLTIDPTIIGAASALGGVLVGALAEGIRARLAFRREKSWVIHEERRAHLEEVYEVLERLREAYSLIYADALRTLAIGPSDKPGQFMKPVPWARLRMLVFLYLPELKAQLADIELTGPKLGSAAADAMMEASGSPARKQQVVTTLDHALSDLTKTVDAMRDQIVIHSRAIVAEKTKSVGGKLPKV
jgi:hypothetical protein